jgi:hypothetical protein
MNVDLDTVGCEQVKHSDTSMPEILQAEVCWVVTKIICYWKPQLPETIYYAKRYLIECILWNCYINIACKYVKTYWNLYLNLELCRYLLCKPPTSTPAT